MLALDIRELLAARLIVGLLSNACDSLKNFSRIFRILSPDKSGNLMFYDENSCTV